jgi:(+)-trans-carveol dehydrogenase
MDRVAGKVALVTGAARGLGRAFAVRLAQEGADIIALDVQGDITGVRYGLGSKDDLDQTGELIRQAGRQVFTGRVDIRDRAALASVVSTGVAALGRLDIVCANAGIFSGGALEDVSESDWSTTLGINVTGTFNTIQAAAPHVIGGGRGGSVIITSSAAAERGLPNVSAYGVSKAAVSGLMRDLAVELAPHSIRVNTVAPSIANTKMALSTESVQAFLPQLSDPTAEQVKAGFSQLSARPNTPWVEPSDVANAVLFLASEEARFVSGLQLKIDNAFSA